MRASCVSRGETERTLIQEMFVFIINLYLCIFCDLYSSVYIYKVFHVFCTIVCVHIEHIKLNNGITIILQIITWNWIINETINVPVCDAKEQIL